MRADFRPYEGNEPYIFISYAHKNSNDIIPILNKLDAAGYRVWYDDGIAPGSEWPEYIAEHLNHCNVVIAFVSPESIASPNCRREVTYSLAKQKPFLGVMLKQTQMSPGMEMQLSAQQCILRYNYRTEEEFISKLIETDLLKPCLRPAETKEAPVAAADTPQQAAPAAERPADSFGKGASGSKTVPKETAESGKKKSPLIWIIPAAACLLIVGVLAITGVFRGKDPDPAEESRRSSAAATQEVVSNDTKPAQTDPTASQTEASKEAPAEETTAAPAEVPTEAPEDVPLKGELVKLMSMTTGSNEICMVHGSGLIYGDYASELLGLKSLDGVSDTGLLYSMNYSYIYGQYEDYEGKYLVVTSEISKPQKSAASLNRLGIMDSKGRIIVPEGYAHIIDANAYYAVCIRVSEETTDPAEAVIAWTASSFSSGASSSDKVYFKGEWELVSLETGKPVPGFSGTKLEEYSELKYDSSYRGSLIEAEYEKKYIQADGNEMRADAKVLENGSYLITEPSKGTVYDTNGKELFTFDPNECTIRLGDNNVGYFAVRKTAEGTGYTLLDKNGQPASTEFICEDAPRVYGPFIMIKEYISGSGSRGWLYDRQGNLITSDPIYGYINPEYDELHHVLQAKTMKEETKNYLFVNDDGEILLDVPESEVNVDGFRIRKDGKNYNFSTKAFDLNGDSVSHDWWISVKNAGGKYDLVDTFTGEALLRGYDDYEVAESPDYGTVVGALYNQTVDVFLLR